MTGRVARNKGARGENELAASSYQWRSVRRRNSFLEKAIMDSIGPRITTECKKCFSTVGRLTGPSNGKIHISGIRCENCQTFIKWLSKEEAGRLDREAADWLETKWVEPDSQVNLL